jgi:dipicolinate synthase subunit A
MKPNLCISFTSYIYYTETLGKIKHNGISNSIFWDERVIFMNGIRIYCAGNTAALTFTRQNLLQRGFEITPLPAPDVTHLLLPVPSFEADGRIRGGGILAHILTDLPENITVVGGNLHNPNLHGYPTIDLLQDARYVAENAAITADCAIRIARAQMAVIWRKCPVLVIGWGRIGKCLADQLKALGADVTVAARKDADLAVLQALGYGCENSLHLNPSRYRVIFNTVPAAVLSKEQCKTCDPSCVKIELASKPGIDDLNVISAPGLPAKYAPETSGKLIADTFVRLLQGKERTL